MKLRNSSFLLVLQVLFAIFLTSCVAHPPKTGWPPATAQGVLVRAIVDGSGAALHGIKPGDEIQAVNETATPTPQDLRSLIQQEISEDSTKRFIFLIKERSGDRRFVVIPALAVAANMATLGGFEIDE